MKTGRRIINVLLAASITLTTVSWATAAGDDIKIPEDATEYNGHYYKVYHDSMMWSEAKAMCESIGGHLATVSDANEQTFLETLVSLYPQKENYWLGGFYSDEIRNWVWVDGSSFVYSNWDVRQPDNNSGDEEFLRMVNQDITYSNWSAHMGKWNDTADSADGDGGEVPLNSFGYICEWDISSTQSESGIPTGAVEYNGHFYYVFPNICDSWEDAKLYCESLGGHLAVINDEAENKRLYQLMKEFGYSNAYFGLSDVESEGSWKWVTGENATYTNWSNGEPNNERGKEHYAMFYYKSSEYKWNDGDFENGTSNDHAAFICEWEDSTVGGFIDVQESDWFAECVLWAVNNGVTNGTSTNTFSPNTICTTAQILTFLWRATGATDPDINNPFSDVKESDYFYKPALWAYKNGLVSSTVLNGNTPCTRAATVTYLWKLAGKPIQGNNMFSDVPNNADYAQAVAWAVDQGVTTGTSANTFSPEQICTRAQIVTFLYRYISLNISATPKPNPDISENLDIFDKNTSFLGNVSYIYNGTELSKNKAYYSGGDTIIEDMTIPTGTKVSISGDLEIKGYISLSPKAELFCDGNLTVSSDGIIDLSSGGTISCDGSFTFDSATNHIQYLTAGLIEVGDDFESKRNFYASGSNEVHILGYRVHTINMWDKWVQDDQYFNIFRVVDHGIEILDVKEPFHCNAENGFIMDDWSWLKVDYYGSDFQFVGVPSPSESLKGILQTGLMLAIASEGQIVEFGGIEYIGVDADEYIFSVYSPQQKQVITYTLEDISVTGLGLTTGKVATGQFRYNGRLYGFAPSPELSTKIWQDFKNTATILAITEIGDVYLDAYKNIVKSLISDVLPNSLQDAFEITSIIEDNSEIFENYQTLSQIND